jgi:MOSC domain-containing protein YiiM
MTARIVSLNRSNGGVPKARVEQARATRGGMEGDRQDDSVHHGGPDRALSLYSLELIDQLRLEGHPIEPGAAGENVTISGVDWSRLKPGIRMWLGDVEIEITSFASPCTTIREAFLDHEFTRISEKVNPGWSRVYARVLREGLLRVDDVVKVEQD